MKFLKNFFNEFWKGTTAKLTDKVSFEFGGFILCLFFVIILFWWLGLIEPIDIDSF